MKRTTRESGIIKCHTACHYHNYRWNNSKAAKLTSLWYSVKSPEGILFPILFPLLRIYSSLKNQDWAQDRDVKASRWQVRKSSLCCRYTVTSQGFLVAELPLPAADYQWWLWRSTLDELSMQLCVWIWCNCKERLTRVCGKFCGAPSEAEVSSKILYKCV